MKIFFTFLLLTFKGLNVQKLKGDKNSNT